MNGGGFGEVSGEVIKKHLTIGKADKHWDSGPFGEVLPRFSNKPFSATVILLLAMVCIGVADSLRASQRPSLTQSATITNSVSDYL